MDQPTAHSHHAPVWRVFMRAMADEVDSLAGAGERDEMLRGIGRRMARAMPLPPSKTLDALEWEINDTLESIGWGRVSMRVHEGERALMLSHAGLPRVGSGVVASGQWLSALLEGLYEVWLAQQPGSQPTLSVQRQASSGSEVVLRYARA